MDKDFELMQTYDDIIACDLSLRRPGFAILRYNITRRNVRV